MSSASATTAEPRMPERTRILRPSLWIDATTATMTDSAFRAYLGIATCADDDGWLLWRPPTLAAHLLRYLAPARRTRLLAKATDELREAGLLMVHDCGCAFLPYLARDLRVTGGSHASTVREYHESHTATDVSVQVSPSPASGSGSESGSGSSSGSVPGPVSEPGSLEQPPARLNGGGCCICHQRIDDADPGVRMTPSGLVHDECRDALIAGARPLQAVAS